MIIAYFRQAGVFFREGGLPPEGNPPLRGLSGFHPQIKCNDDPELGCTGLAPSGACGNAFIILTRLALRLSIPSHEPHYDSVNLPLIFRLSFVYLPCILRFNPNYPTLYWVLRIGPISLRTEEFIISLCPSEH